MNQTGQIVFIVFIIAYMLFWGTIICIGIPKEERRKQQKKYDERQIFEQSRACKYSYVALIVYLLFYGILDAGFDIVWCEPLFGICLGIGFSLSVFFAYCIFQDAYFAIGESKLGVLIAPNIIAFPQLILGLECVTDRSIIDNGIITDNGLHFLFVALILILDILVYIRKRLDKQSA